MILCLNIGDTYIYGGVFLDHEIKLRFRYPSVDACTDTYGLFLKEVLEKNGIDKEDIRAVSLCSVAQTLGQSIIAVCKKYFSITPFELKAGIKTGIELEIKNPLKLGADRMASAVASAHHFPNRNLIIVDFSMATTLSAQSNEKVYLGGAILPGIKSSIEAFSDRAEKLSDAIKEVTQRTNQSIFLSEPAILISTGDYAHLFEQEKFFTINVPDLVLHGLRLVLEKNK